MKKNWQEPFRYDDIEKIILKRCKNPEDIKVLFIRTEKGEHSIRVQYSNRGVNHEIFMEEFGEMYTLNPFDNVDYFRTARKKNTNRKINGQTFEEAFIKHYYEEIYNYRDELLDAANNEKDETEQLKKTHQAQDIYLLLIDRVNEFIEKYKIKMPTQDEFVCEC